MDIFFGKFLVRDDFYTHQIPIKKNSIYQTGFVMPDGKFEYLRMPCGLANSPAVFQRALEN
jgi:hypothetical protein